MKKSISFLKLGGSLITDKNLANTALHEIIDQLAQEIKLARDQQPDMHLLLGHGSGSFGHFAARRHGTRQGVKSDLEWAGFIEVWQSARQLNEIVLAALHAAALPVICITPSAAVISENGQIASWDTQPIQSALEHGLIPMVFGDVVFDTRQGGAILSTEELFLHLCNELKPTKILLAANDPVYSDFPGRNNVLPLINSKNIDDVRNTLSGGEGSDVTGGMLSKVEAALEMVTISNADAWIFSGIAKGQIKKALLNQPIGTQIST
jgi:isopentenyl phosphate kinase